MPESSLPSPGAERSRRYRARQRGGVVVTITEVYEGERDALVKYGFLNDADTEDRDALCEAVGKLLADVAKQAQAG